MQLDIQARNFPLTNALRGHLVKEMGITPVYNMRNGNNDLDATGALIFAGLRWSWAIGLGYAASIWVHFLINAESF